MGEFFYRLAIFSSVVSALTVFLIAVSGPLIYLKSVGEWDAINERSDKFREKSNNIWANLQTLQFGPVVGGEEYAGSGASQIQYFSRRRRAAYGQQVCSGCNQLNCQAGGPGLPGPPGEDGLPGMSGMTGKAGEDGYDVELEPENDLPCVICPAGPPGQRGMQGERGQPGNPGHPGISGPPGKQGADGPRGNHGSPGSPGIRGYLGPPGPPGDTTIAGVGIRGPRGPPGPAGPKGPMGSPGKSSRDQGMPGRPGPGGVSGPIGNAGRAGEEGPFGPPGEPGQPAAYCPSDCGVSQILAPSIHMMGDIGMTAAASGDAAIGYPGPAPIEVSEKPAYSADGNRGGYYSRYSTL